MSKLDTDMSLCDGQKQVSSACKSTCPNQELSSLSATTATSSRTYVYFSLLPFPPAFPLFLSTFPPFSPSSLQTLKFHVLTEKKWRDGIPQGWLARDHPAWFRSTQRLKQLERTTRGVVVPGHDKELFEKLIANGISYT
jgi:hypothetical protein